MAPPAGVQEDYTSSDFDPDEAFLATLMHDDEAPEPAPKQKARVEPVESDLEPLEEPEEEEEEVEEKPKEPDAKLTPAEQRRQAADDDEVIVQVGDDAKRVSVKDLKRLFGQEASLTQKSQQVAEVRRAVEAQATKYGEGIAKMTKEAGDRWAEYQKIDYLTAKDAMSPESFLKLREDAQRAHDLHKFYSEEAGSVQQQQTQARTQALQAAAQESLKVIQDPASKNHIEGWSNAVYDDIRNFAVNEMGAPAAVVNQITDPWALKVLHLASLQSKGAKEVALITAKPRPVVKAGAKQVLVSKEAPVPAKETKTNRQTTAMTRLQRSGDVDDAANAFLAGWDIE